MTEDEQALAAFTRWLQTIGDDDDAVDEESGLTGAHVHAVLRLAERGALPEEVASAFKREFGYVPDVRDGERWSVFEDSLMVMHGRYGVRVYKRGYGGVYYEMIPHR